MAESVIRALRKRKLVKITLITVGKVKEKYLRDAIAEYSKRLGRYCKLDIVEVADEKTPEHAERRTRTAESRPKRANASSNIFVTMRSSSPSPSKASSSPANSSPRNQRPRTPRHQPYPTHHRRLIGTRPRDSQTSRLPAELFQNDVPAPADAGDSAGADLSRIQNQRRRTLPQVIFEAFRKKR